MESGTKQPWTSEYWAFGPPVPVLHWNGNRVFTPVNCGFDSRPGCMSSTPKWNKGDRVYSKTWGANATVVAVDANNATPIYIIRLDGSKTDSYNVYERHLGNPK